MKMSIQSHSQYTLIGLGHITKNGQERSPFLKSEKYLISGEFMEIAAGFFLNNSKIVNFVSILAHLN